MPRPASRGLTSVCTGDGAGLLEKSRVPPRRGARGGARAGGPPHLPPAAGLGLGAATAPQPRPGTWHGVKCGVLGAVLLAAGRPDPTPLGWRGGGNGPSGALGARDRELPRAFSLAQWGWAGRQGIAASDVGAVNPGQGRAGQGQRGRPGPRSRGTGLGRFKVGAPEPPRQERLRCDVRALPGEPRPSITGALMMARMC